MDIDAVLEPVGAAQHDPFTPAASGDGRAPKSHKRRVAVVVDDAHPFDLAVYISGYTGRAAINRLRFIAENCEQLAPEALQRAAPLVLKTSDPALYQKTVQDYNNLPAAATQPLPFNTEWYEATTEKNISEKDRLETELKTYTSNMIKESIRMGHRDLGDYYWVTGEFVQALKHYNKSREYCTTPQHMLEYSLTVLQLLVETSSYNHISTYVFKATSSLAPSAETASDAKKTAPPPPAGSAAAAVAASATVNSEKERANAKINYASGLASMAAGQFEKAAFAFGSLTRSLEPWFSTIVAPSDVAIYGVLCGLASMTRSAIKANFHNNESFSFFLEQEPFARELLDAYMNSRFKVVLELLERNSSRHNLDIHLAPHINALTNEIKNRALVLYFQPFASVQLSKMALAFGLSASEVERLVVLLIQEGKINGRIDSKNKILKVQDVDPRVALFKRAIKTGADTQAATRKMLLRMKLVQADLVVRAPKNRENNNPNANNSGQANQQAFSPTLQQDGFAMVMS